MKNIVLQCSCRSEALELEYDEEYKTLDISMWIRGHQGKLSFLERLRWCRQIMFKGSPWTDEIILEPDNIQKLKDYLNEI